jgi:hypothetical protein
MSGGPLEQLSIINNKTITVKNKYGLSIKAPLTRQSQRPTYKFDTFASAMSEHQPIS